MFNSIANRHAEGEKEDLSDGEESSAENNVTDRPSVIEGTEHEDELRDDVDDNADDRPEEVDYPKSYGLIKFEAGELFECGDGDEERDAKDNKTGNS